RAPDAGAIHLVPGGRAGLVTGDGWTIAPPELEMVNFGSRLRAGDVDADGHPDLVEGSATRWSDPGHAAYCAGSPTGPSECRRLGSAGATSLAVADVDDDGRADIVQGNAALPPVSDVAGEVLVWLGGSEGPSSSPISITQETRGVPGHNQAGDRFGAVVDAGDVDGDGYADMVIGAPGESGFAGRITVVRGGRDGLATTAHSSFDQKSPAVPGRRRTGSRFGSAIAVLQLTDDRRLDVAVAARGEDGGEQIMVVEGGPGVFAPAETRTSTLKGAGRYVRAEPGVLLRLARTSGG
ncbi:MAG TPA: FG-GAP and VCBS repeat-containing protein, partial [Solirubrobacteraceae bacterium]|nr:FG-GAP and VCBS repeat-containing protein [Solirubrobacteraceae bacterium]